MHLALVNKTIPYNLEALMKKVLPLVILMLLFSVTNVLAYKKGSKPSLDPNYSHDANGRLTRNDNMWNDSDSDGVSNYYDHNDRNSSKW